ncbi:MAG: class I SAM-dependent methyltransferase [Anaerolineales bacterium]
MDKYPLLFHAHHSQHNEDLQFWLDLASSQGSPILELGCGSGRVLIHLVQAGHQVLGLDRDANMLTFLKKQCPNNFNDRLHLIQADMTAFCLRQDFPLIICPCNTFSMLSIQERQSALECSCLHLASAGLFVVALPNPQVLKKLPSQPQPELEEIITHPISGDPIQVSAAWNTSPKELIVDWFYDHLIPDGRVERTRIQIRHDLSTPEVLLDEIKNANLDPVNIFGDFDYSQFSENSPHMIILAQKKSGNP